MSLVEMVCCTCGILAAFGVILMTSALDQQIFSNADGGGDDESALLADDYDDQYDYIEDIFPIGNISNCSVYSVEEEEGVVRMMVCEDGKMFDAVSLQCLPPEQVICTSNETLDSTIVRKCCRLDQVLNSAYQCVTSPARAQWFPTLYQMTPGDRTLKPIPHAVFNTHVAEFIDETCDQLVNITMKDQRKEAVYLLQNGSLYVRKDHEIFMPAAYCVDQIMDVDKDGSTDTSPSTSSSSSSSTSSSTPSSPRTRLAAKYCSSAPSPHKLRANDGSIFIYLCEPLSKAMNLKSEFIDEQNSGWVPPLAPSTNGTRIKWTELEEYFDFGYGYPECDNIEDVYYTDYPFLIQDSGNVTFSGSDQELTANDYCVTRIVMGQVEVNDSALPLYTKLYNTVLVKCDKPPINQVMRAEKNFAAVKKCCSHNQNVWIGNIENSSGLSQDCAVTETDFFAKHLNGDDLGINPNNLPIRISGIIFGSIMTEKKERFYIEKDGTISIFNENNCMNENHQEYCIDYSLNGKNMVAFFVHEQIDLSTPGYYWILFSLDLAALLITFVLYLVLPDPAQISLNRRRKLRQTILGKILLSYLASMILLVATFFVHQQAQYSPGCIAAGVLEHFAWISSFGWLMIISVEIYWGTKQTKRVSGGPRFRLYSLLGWLLPVLLSSIVLALDFIPGAQCYVYRPDFGSRCGVSGMFRRQLYITLPIGVMVVICSVLYSLTVCNVREANRRAGNSQSSKISQQQQERNVLCIKLFLVMGIPWLLDLISGWTNDDVFLAICDVIVLLQPIMIFVVFIMRGKLLKYIWSHLQSLGTCQVIKTSSTTPQPGSSLSYVKHANMRSSMTESTEFTSVGSASDH